MLSVVLRRNGSSGDKTRRRLIQPATIHLSHFTLTVSQSVDSPSRHIRAHMERPSPRNVAMTGLAIRTGTHPASRKTTCRHGRSGVSTATARSLAFVFHGYCISHFALFRRLASPKVQRTFGPSTVVQHRLGLAPRLDLSSCSVSDALGITVLSFRCLLAAPFASLCRTSEKSIMIFSKRALSG